MSEQSLPASRSLRDTAWVNSTYFAEGYPFILVRFLASAFFTQLGVKERYLGFLNFLGIPWNLKFLWAPLLDLYGTKRRWLIGIEITLSVLLLILAGLAGWAYNAIAIPDTLLQAISQHQILQLITFILIAIAFVAATHDIAIDAYYLAALQSPTAQACYTGDRVLSYRIAVIYVKSGLVALVAVVGWFAGWMIAALTMSVLCIAHALWLPQPETSVAPRAHWRDTLREFAHSFRTYLDQPRVFVMLAFILTYKLGDELIFSMNSAFLLRELGLTTAQLAWVAGLVGTTATIAGSLLSAWWIARVGLARAIWPLTLLMNVNIWAYVLLAWFKPNPATLAGISWIAIADGYELFAAGLGNAVLLTYLLRTCRPEFKAGHYAIGSALISLGGTLFGGFGGILVEQMGYTWFYILSFLATIPAMALIRWVPYLGDRN